MPGQMCWVSQSGSNGELTLHLRLFPHQPWKSYTQFPELMVSDYRIPGASKGFATSQKLLKAGWALIPTSQAQKFSIDASEAAYSHF